jgi:hypothetical protein
MGEQVRCFHNSVLCFSRHKTNREYDKTPGQYRTRTYILFST